MIIPPDGKYEKYGAAQLEPSAVEGMAVAANDNLDNDNRTELNDISLEFD